jgi:cardiolipin synthase
VRVPDEDRIATLPNAISVARLLCVPVFLWLLFGRDNRAAAAGVLAALGATDWVDGYAARHLGQVSTLGKILDPTADRVLLVVGLGAILVDGSAPAPVVWLALAREVAVAAAALALAAFGARRIDVTWVGKAGTFGLMAAFPLFLLSESTVSWRDAAGVLAWLAVVPALVLSYIAAVGYVPLARTALAEGRVGSGP